MRELFVIIPAFIPLIFLAVDMLVVLLRRQKSGAVEPLPKLQLWIQDFFFLTFGFTVAMALKFDRVFWTSTLFPALSAGLGFLAAADMASARTRVSPPGRALIFGGVMAGFVWSIWISSSLWFIWKRIAAWRAGRGCVDRTSRIVAGAVVLLYATAFFLPMNQHNAIGKDAYILSCLFSTDRLSPGELPMMALAWTANPCVWIALAFLLEGRRWMAAVIAFLAIVVAWPISISGEFSVLNSPGYGVWFGSMLVLFVLAVAAVNRRLRERLN